MNIFCYINEYSIQSSKKRISINHLSAKITLYEGMYKRTVIAHREDTNTLFMLVKLLYFILKKIIYTTIFLNDIFF